MSVPFRFRLETVLRVRRIEEDRAKEVLAAMTRRVALSAAALRQASAACEALPTVLAPMDSGAFADFRQRAGWLVERASAAREALDDALAEHELARAAAIGARQKVATLERLAERRRREWMDERERAEVRAIDDVVSARSAAQRMEQSRAG